MKEFASECKWLCERNCDNFVLAAEIACEWNLSLLQHSLAIANAKAWCTQIRTSPRTTTAIAIQPPFVVDLSAPKSRKQRDIAI